MSGSKQLEKEDIMILVLGATGAGKSFFINAMLGEEKMKVGSDLASCTAELDFGYLEKIEGYRSPKGYRIALVDTPGFDDQSVNDLQTSEKISSWLRQSYKKGSKLGGILYLYEITAPRFDNAARQNLRIIRRLCGDGPLDNVILTTTKWSLKTPASEDLQTELISNYWKSLIEKGARVRRFDAGHESAWSVVEILVTAIEEGRLIQTVEPKATTGAKNSTPHKFLQAFRPFIGLFRKSVHSAV